MPDLSWMLAQAILGTIGPAVIAFSAGLVIVGIIAGLKGRGWRGLAIAIALLVGSGVGTLIAVNTGRGSIPSESQAVLDIGIGRNAEMLFHFGLIAGAATVLVLGLPILFSRP